MHLFHIPQCSIKNRMRTFLIWMKHCGMWNRCIMGFSTLVYRQQIRVHSCVYWGTNWHWNWVFRCYSNLYKHMQSSAVITRSNIVTYNMIYYRNWGRLSIDAGSTKDTPYLALMAELWGVFCEYLWENWQCYNDTARYSVYQLVTILSWYNCIKRPLNSVVSRRQVVFHGSENKHGFLRTVWGKWWNVCVFLQDFPGFNTQVPLYTEWYPETSSEDVVFLPTFSVHGKGINSLKSRDTIWRCSVELDRRWVR